MDTTIKVYKFRSGGLVTYEAYLTDVHYELLGLEPPQFLNIPEDENNGIVGYGGSAWEAIADLSQKVSDVVHTDNVYYDYARPDNPMSEKYRVPSSQKLDKE